MSNLTALYVLLKSFCQIGKKISHRLIFFSDIPTALSDDVLCDPVYRFAYDQYGHDGVHYVRQCQQVKASQQKHQQLLLPIDIHLYSKLHTMLQSQGDAQLRAAIKMFCSAMERYKQQVRLARQRLRDSAFTVETTIELPCAHHPQGANVAFENDSIIPYLELEEAHIDVSVRTTNRQQPQNQQSSDDDDDDDAAGEQKPSKPQRHIYAATAGVDTRWEATGRCGADVSLSTDYQIAAASKTTWNVEVTAPITKVPAKRSSPSQRPIKMQVSSTHEFLSGTVMNAGVRGSNVSLESWEYFVTSFRKLSIGWLEEPSQALNTNALSHNVRGSFAMGVKMFSGQPLFGFVSMTTIPPPKSTSHQHQHQHSPYDENGDDSATTNSVVQAIFNTPLEFSTPVLSVRAGYHPNPIHASIKYDEFGKPWASLSSSWAWSISTASSNIKVMLSTDLWGIYEDNDTTTVRTGVKHDLESGWVWLWEWEEQDWTLKIPISLSISKNAAWIAAAVGTEVLTSDLLHSSLGSLIASYFVVKVARSLVSDWTNSEGTHSSARRKSSQSDATFQEQDKSQDSFRLDADNDTSEGKRGRQPKVFQSLTSSIAEKKRQSEATNGGLVIRSAKVIIDTQTSLEKISPPSVGKGSQDLTDTLQFWVKDGKLSLPALSSQATPYHYSIGATTTSSSASVSSKRWSSFRHISDSLAHLMQPSSILNWWQDITATSLYSRANLQVHSQNYRRTGTPTTSLIIRYEWGGNLYEQYIREDEDIVLPNSSRALLLGNAATIT